MQRCRPTRWLALLALSVILPVAHATTVIAPDFDSMVGRSDYIVRAVVKSVTPEWRNNPDKPGQRYIATMVELDVKEVIKGTPPSPLVLDLVGGRIDDRELTIEGAPKFTVGQESVLFVRGNGRQIVPLVGMMHGKYNVRRNKATGRDEVLRNNGNPLYSEKEVALPETALSTAPASNPQAQPLTPAEFIARIKKSGKFNTREKLE
ncbi:MAG TPA: hypothetical protein VG734_12465 [Lacunisphaera sp.]|nr:hypothetical protein [Lacunisphaera sp.]